jgi:hypothetical protein
MGLKVQMPTPHSRLMRSEAADRTHCEGDGHLPFPGVELKEIFSRCQTPGFPQSAPQKDQSYQTPQALGGAHFSSLILPVGTSC